MVSRSKPEVGATNCPPQVQAQLLLGQMHVDKGWFTDAFLYFEAAARSDHPAALNMLGRAYERGWGVPRNPERAALCFGKAARLGDAWAMFNLADLLLLGDGVPKNRVQAYELYVSSAEKGNVKALNMLGLLHEEGLSGCSDMEGAHLFYQAAARGGDCWGELNLARLALQQQDRATAVSCFRRAMTTKNADVLWAIIKLVLPYNDPALKCIASTAVRQVNEADGVNEVPLRDFSDVRARPIVAEGCGTWTSAPELLNDHRAELCASR